MKRQLDVIFYKILFTFFKVDPEPGTQKAAYRQVQMGGTGTEHMIEL